MHSEIQIVVFYDDRCGRCVRGAQRLHRSDRAGRFRLVGLTGGEQEAVSAGLSPERLNERMHLIDRAGRVRQGSEAVAYILRQFPLTYLLGLILSLPGFRWGAAWLYDRLARNRQSEAVL